MTNNTKTDNLQLARQRLLEPGNVSLGDLEAALAHALATGGDFADLYFQQSRLEAWTLEDQRVKSGSHSIDQGVGVRVNSGEKTGFAYAESITPEGIREAATHARSIARTSTGETPAPVRIEARQPPLMYAADDVLTAMDNRQIIETLQAMDARARASDPRVHKVICSLVTAQETMLVAASDGTLAADVRPMVKISIQVMAQDNQGRMEIGFAGGGGRRPLHEILAEPGLVDSFVDQAVKTALINLKARPAPAGTMPVVVGSGWPGVLLHEAIGHGLEGDFNRKGSSAFSGRIGERVASDACTVIDSGILPGRRGSLTVDDEGTPAAENVLIENGILRGYMQDKLNARLMGMQPTGNGRRESFAHLPMPRMTNTYMLAGEYDPQEIIASVDKGLYAVNFAGGQVDITNGKFVFSANEAYLIENGKITTPVKGATLIGDGPTVLTRVSMVGNDLAFDQGLGVCGKDGQSVPVGIGQPTLRVDELTVGGTQL